MNLVMNPNMNMGMNSNMNMGINNNIINNNISNLSKPELQNNMNQNLCHLAQLMNQKKRIDIYGITELDTILCSICEKSEISKFGNIQKDAELDDAKKENIILEICDIMIYLELPKSLVKNVTSGFAGKEFGEESEQHKSTVGLIISKIIKAKYFSKSAH